MKGLTMTLPAGRSSRQGWLRDRRSDGAAAAERSDDDAERGGAMRQVSDHLPLVLTVISLLALAVLPLVVHSSIERYLLQISEQIDPARRAADEVQLALSIEAAGTRAFLVTGDDRYAASFKDAHARRLNAYAQLVEAASVLDAGLEAEVAAIGEQSAPADRLLAQLYAREVSRDAYVENLQAQHVRFTTLVAAMAHIQQRIDSVAADRRRRIHTIHRRSVAITLGGLLLALLAIASVARLSAAQRALATRERSARAAAEHAQAEAAARRDATDRIRASRNRLIRGFSHDLKNPLGAADGYLFMLQEGFSGSLDAKQLACIEKSRRSLKSAHQLIHDLLELARAETGDIELHLSPIDIREVAGAVVDDYRGQAHAKGISLVSELPGALPLVNSDPARVGQILGNLVTNAIKYTASGSVKVRVGIRRDAEGIERAAIDVIDTGPGIPAEYQDRIFEEYQRIAPATATGGAGIGLAISKRIAELLNGRLTVLSEPQCGSSFTLWLPLESAEPHASEA